MAIARDVASPLFIQSTLSGTSVSGTLTTAGTNRFLVVAAYCYSGGHADTATYAGIDMNLYAQITANSATSAVISLFYLSNPALGANTLTVSGVNPNAYISAEGVNYTGVGQFLGGTTGTATGPSGIQLSLSPRKESTAWGVGYWYSATASSATANVSNWIDGYIWDTNGNEFGSFNMSVTAANATGSPANGAIGIAFGASPSPLPTYYRI